jgi:citrate synthase
MTTHVNATEAARLLGVTKATLYAYVSRGLLDRRTAVDGRTSLYSRDAIDALIGRSRRRRPPERASIDVQIASVITELHDDRVLYRGHDVARLSRSTSFEQVAELLWTGRVPDDPPTWEVDRDALDRCRAVIATAAPDDPIIGLTLAATTLAGDAGHRGDASAVAARRLLALTPSLLGGPVVGDVATRLAHAWANDPDPALIAAISRALILLADHELATSTLGVRVAASVRTDAYTSLATGLSVVRGSLHGAASSAAAELIDASAVVGAGVAVDRVLSSGARLPGFGHTVYRNGDPRLAPMLEAVEQLPDSGDRWAVVTDVLAEAGRRIGHLPNIDLGLGALLHVADLPRESPIVGVARLAGWAAHAAVDRSERPVGYRGLARPVN